MQQISQLVVSILSKMHQNGKINTNNLITILRD